MSDIYLPCEKRKKCMIIDIEIQSERNTLVKVTENLSTYKD